MSIVNTDTKEPDKSQDIIDKLRYPMSHTISKCDLAPGDHIYCWRKSYLYQHHGIYFGDGEVINFDGEIINASAASVIKQTLDQFSNGDTIKKVKYNVSKTYFTFCRAGSCNVLKKDDSKVIVQRAKSALGSGKGKYNVIDWNCETFCLWCTLGGRYTNSVQSTSTPISGLGAALGMFAGPFGAVFGGAAVGVITGAILAKKQNKIKKLPQ
eukprot:UN12729